MADYFCGIFSSGAAELIKRNRVIAQLVAAMQADIAAIAVYPGSVMVYMPIQLHDIRYRETINREVGMKRVLAVDDDAVFLRCYEQTLGE